MLLSELGLGTLIGEDRNFTGININSKLIKKGDIYVAIIGKLDGNNYVEEAIKNGAVAIISEKDIECEVPLLLVSNSRKALAIISAKFYDNAHTKLKIIAVTGTNGKTTTTHYVESIIKSCDKKVGLIGSMYVRYNDKLYDAKLTTPDPHELHAIFFDMVKNGIEYVVMEASAHALALDKLYGINFEVGIFTNLSNDHLDFFNSIDIYKAAKKKLFKMCKYSVINSDDIVGKEIVQEVSNNVKSYAIENQNATFLAKNINYDNGGTTYNVIDNDTNIEYQIRTCLIGKFNIYNSLSAFVCGKCLKLPTSEIINGIRNVNKVEGRFDIINGKKFDVIIDYAHTPEGLKNVLIAAKDITRNKLILVFGCGGDRDKSKREIMGSIADSIADIIIVTNDNPRNENPQEIINQIKKGIKNQSKCTCIENRKSAIIKAIEIAESGDTILVCGKGAEKYLEINDTKIPFKDEEIIKTILNEKNL